MAWKKRFLRPDTGFCWVFHGRYFCIEYRQWTVFYSCTALDIANIYHCNCIRGGTQMA